MNKFYTLLIFSLCFVFATIATASDQNTSKSDRLQWLNFSEKDKVSFIKQALTQDTNFEYTDAEIHEMLPCIMEFINLYDLEKSIKDCSKRARLGRAARELSDEYSPKWSIMSDEDKTSSIKQIISKDYPNFEYTDTEIDQMFSCIKKNPLNENIRGKVETCSKKFRLAKTETAMQPLIDCVTGTIPKELQNKDTMLVVTAYGGLYADFQRGKYSKEQVGELFQRVVSDEYKHIRNPEDKVILDGISKCSVN